MCQGPTYHGVLRKALGVWWHTAPQAAEGLVCGGMMAANSGNTPAWEGQQALHITHLFTCKVAAQLSNSRCEQRNTQGPALKMDSVHPPAHNSVGA